VQTTNHYVSMASKTMTSPSSLSRSNYKR